MSLFEAIRGKNIEEVKNILRGGEVDFTMRDSWGNTALHLAVQMKGWVEICRELINAGADVNAFTNGMNQSSVFHIATRAGDLEICSLLIERNADINAIDGRGNRAIDYAIDYNYIDIFRLIAGNGSDLSYKHEDGMTILHRAIGSNSLEICEELINTLLKIGFAFDSDDYSVDPLELVLDKSISSNHDSRWVNLQALVSYHGAIALEAELADIPYIDTVIDIIANINDIENI